jgi:nicotinamide-nucleotide amidase
MDTIKKIYQLNRYGDKTLSPWFQSQLYTLMAFGVYHNDFDLIQDKLVSGLTEYRNTHSKHTVVIGISGGIDSALAASLFKSAGYRTIGVTMPIHQNPVETDLGVEACGALSLEHKHIDLTDLYDYTLKDQARHDPSILSDDRSAKMRRGNIRARLRMITLYNLAGAHNGFVGSTDNFSELASGFWTLHGDVGDVAPIQSLTKSWEVPMMAERMGVPSGIIQAVPTDGLGIANGDEDQLGCSYLEFDIALFSLMRNSSIKADNDEDQAILNKVGRRIATSAFKRANPYNFLHPMDSVRYQDLEQLDYTLRSKL